MIRKSVRDLVDLCQYVTEKDARATEAAHADVEGEGPVPEPDPPVESFCKIQWRRRREAQRLAHHGHQTDQVVPSECTEEEDAATPTLSEGPQEIQDPHKDLIHYGDVDADEEGDGDTCHPVLPFDQFLNEFIASELDVRDVRRLSATSSDPLGVVSTPTRREGYSLTLSRFETVEQLIVFGGRQLRDLTNLLPVAATLVDPLKLERVRYVFSNGVYVYDLHTTRWSLRQCSGKYPKERSDHSAVFVAPHFLVVFGGRGRSGALFNDLFVLSLQDWHWTQLDTHTRPSARYWHGCCCVANEQLFVFGGKSEVDVYGDLQQFPIGKAVQALVRLHNKQDMEQQDSGATANSQQPRGAVRADSVFLPLAWTSPHTVGSAPSPRFGLRMLRIDHDRIAFVGGWRGHHHTKNKNKVTARTVDVFILDTTTMVWTKPRFSSHICRLSAPPARFQFECFYTQRCIVVFGGFTYATNGETESYSALSEEPQHVIYKLDLHRMIWRRQVVQDGDTPLLRTSYPHFSSNAIVRMGQDPHSERIAYTSIARSEQLQMQLTAISLQSQRKPHSHGQSTMDASYSIEDQSR